MDIEKYLQEVKDFEREYYEVTKNLSTKIPKILNIEEEKKRFFSALKQNKTYNPQLAFKKKEFNEEDIKRLENLTINTENDIYGIKTLYKERIKTKLLEVMSQHHWGDVKSAEYNLEYRGSPSEELLEKATSFCRDYKRSIIKFKWMRAQEVGEALKEYVYTLTKEILDVCYVSLTNKANIYGKYLELNPYYHFKSLECERLKVHEIGTHYLRYWNGKQTDFKILRTGTSNYLETEEGLAVLMEEKKGYLSNAQMFIYAGRVIATYHVLTKSFYEVYNILKSYSFKDSDAFAITLRAKRNLQDTSLKGGFMKDYLYFSGYFKVKEYEKENSIKDLFVGKIKLEDLKLMDKILESRREEIKTILD